MKVTIDIENCRECPYSWVHTNQNGNTSVVCDKLQDNVGIGLAVSSRCPLGE